jgi:hypothetical protein
MHFTLPHWLVYTFPEQGWQAPPGVDVKYPLGHARQDVVPSGCCTLVTPAGQEGEPVTPRSDPNTTYGGQE